LLLTWIGIISPTNLNQFFDPFPDPIIHSDK
jgi:hypothetical protein